MRKRQKQVLSDCCVSLKVSYCTSLGRLALHADVCVYLVPEKLRHNAQGLYAELSSDEVEPPLKPLYRAVFRVTSTGVRDGYSGFVIVQKLKYPAESEKAKAISNRLTEALKLYFIKALAHGWKHDSFEVNIDDVSAALVLQRIKPDDSASLKDASGPLRLDGEKGVLVCVENYHRY